MDAVTSFSNLLENLPLWKEQVAQLSQHTHQKHEEFKAEYSRLVSQARPRRVKSPSVCSIRTDDIIDPRDIEIQRESTPQPPDLVDIDPFEAGNRYIYAQATKKRKPGTSFRSGASGPLKFRSKQQVVIYYDSHAQDQLDGLVKSIGGSRNNLRKGRNAYVLSRGLQLPTLGRKYDLPSSISGLDGIRSTAAHRNPTKSLKIKGETTSMINEAGSTGDAAFMQVDKELETCQNLCETAAHQLLRDGDCKLELDTVVSNLDKIIGVAEATLSMLKAEADGKKEESLTEDASVAGSTHTESDATLVEKASREMLNVNHKVMPSPGNSFDANRPSLPTTTSAPPMTTTIEVDDDSDQSSIEIDISKYRMTNRAGNRPGVRA